MSPGVKSHKFSLRRMRTLLTPKRRLVTVLKFLPLKHYCLLAGPTKQRTTGKLTSSNARTTSAGGGGLRDWLARFFINSMYEWRRRGSDEMDACKRDDGGGGGEENPVRCVRPSKRHGLREDLVVYCIMLPDADGLRKPISPVLEDIVLKGSGSLRHPFAIRSPDVSAKDD